MCVYQPCDCGRTPGPAERVLLMTSPASSR